jgi:hypothetical protein
MSKDVRIPRMLACRISDRWTVYRILRLPSWGRCPDPWMATAPGKATGRQFATQAAAFAWAQGQAALEHDDHVERALMEVCS